MEALHRALRPVRPWMVYALGSLPLLMLIWQTVNGALGVDPVKTIEHRLGEVALQLIVAGLCVTPLRRFVGLNLMRFRRQIGVLAFVYAGLHLFVWVTLDLQFRWSEIGNDLVKRPYIILGMAAFLMLLPLALTSNNLSIRRMGAAAWQRLHRLVYPAALLAAAHFIWVMKAWAAEPMIYLALITGLLGLRLVPRSRPAQRARVPGPEPR
ncbi:protein-methionine-sulfoxide reductase heme-binding subunit MsrQ [Gemmobacter serpentinus]|uniref:protein-methionine-sulfoxide reductase heme-binding subunit MsrQ n=1 Tax=Gemmobacter serpentinus TaxID=2652247 RepID=UPI00124DC154|nr:protein-methionine-sulfoxide reductase heme-binding subunit MsrQ [Gemmobacter serpentinus]